MHAFSRSNPSPRYRELQALYSQLHREGERSLGIAARDTFPGKSLFPHLKRIKDLIDRTGARTVLDYGSGKGRQYDPQPIRAEGLKTAGSVQEYWGVESIRCYDPGYPQYAELPSQPCDGVVCTDVLEHCPEADLPWIVEEIFCFARRFVYLNVACFPARKHLPNGENAHITVRPPDWWRDLVERVAARHAETAWEMTATQRVDGKPHETVFGRPPAGDQSAITEVQIEGRAARFATPNDMTRWRAQSLYEKEPATIAWLRAIPLGATLVDVGANVGMYSVFAGLARRAQVYAFEPESRNYALLNANIGLNGLAGPVRAFCAGLSDKAGLERLYLSKSFAGASCHSLGEKVGFDLQPRQAAFEQGCIALTLDELVAGGALPVPGYVKIDVDGFEHKVVAGGLRTLSQPQVRGLCIEINHNLEEHLDLVDALGKLGFGHDPRQVAQSERKEGAFKGVAEYVFSR